MHRVMAQSGFCKVSKLRPTAVKKSTRCIRIEFSRNFSARGNIARKYANLYAALKSISAERYEFLKILKNIVSKLAGHPLRKKKGRKKKQNFPSVLPKILRF